MLFFHGGRWQDYRLQSDKDGMYVTATTNKWSDITDVLLSLQGQTNEIVKLNAQGREAAFARSGAFKLITNAVEHFSTGSNNDFYSAARTIDSAGQAATVAGAQTITWDILQNRRDAFARQRDRAWSEIPLGQSQVWAEALALKNESSDLWNDLNGDRKVDTNLYGFMMGHDFRTSDEVLWGAALSFMQGESEADLGSRKLPTTQNEIESFGASVHGAFSMHEWGRAIWDLDFQYANHDITMAMSPELVNVGKLTADVDTWAVQARGGWEYDFTLANMTVTPYAALQYTWIITDGYTSKLDGLKAFTVESANQHIGSVPVGVKMTANFKFDAGREIRPWFNAYVQPNFGDTEADNVVHGEGLTSVDHVSPEVIGELSYGGAVGLRFVTGEMFSTMLSYSYNASDKSENHAMMLNASWKF